MWGRISVVFEPPTNANHKLVEIDYSYHYRKWHNDTPEYIAGVVDCYHRLLRPYLPADKDAPVLDIGCGMGFMMLALKELGFTHVSGIDSDSGQVASCRAKGLEVTQVSDSAAYLREHPGTYQLLLAFDLLEHIPPAHQMEFVSAMANSLRNGGRLIGTTPNANSSLAGRYRYLDWTHQTAFTEHSLDFLLHNGGFDPIEIKEVETVSRPRLWWLPVSGGRHWMAFRFFRCLRRLEMMAELGPAQGRRVPLSLNLLMIAVKA